MREHVHHEQIEGEAGEHRFRDDLGRAEPVLELAAIQHHLQRADGKAQEHEAHDRSAASRGARVC